MMGSCWSRTKTRCSWAARCRRRAVMRITLCFFTRDFARNAARKFASNCAAARPSRPVKAACRTSTARNASIAAHACGTARNRCRKTPSTRTSPFAPAQAVCILRKIEIGSAPSRKTPSVPELNFFVRENSPAIRTASSSSPVGLCGTPSVRRRWIARGRTLQNRSPWCL